MNNQIAQKPSFSVMVNTQKFKDAIANTIQNASRREQFVASIVSAVTSNPTLQKCEPFSVLSSALLGESLNLSPSSQLGQYYLVPFKNKAKYENGRVVKPETMEAQFVLGYKGLIQLALRSGQYKFINVIDVKEGELSSWNPLTEEAELSVFYDDPDKREELKTVGYMAAFELLNGFRKTIYWSKRKVEKHADRYSPAFSLNACTINGNNGRVFNKVSFHDYEAGNYPKSDEWLYSSDWYKNFDGMAFKTLLRQLISKWGIMSIDMQTAFEADKETDAEPFVDLLPTPDAPLPEEPQDPDAPQEPEKNTDTEQKSEPKQVSLDEM